MLTHLDVHPLGIRASCWRLPWPSSMARGRGRPAPSR